jgi:hypothetical protein
VQSDQPISAAQQEAVKRMLAPIVRSLSAELAVLPCGVSASFSPDLMPLVDALTVQTAAINRLAQSNELLVQAMSEGGDLPDEGMSTTFLDGSPRR